jgi:hypothetical protein
MQNSQNPSVTNVQTSLFCNNEVTRTSFTYEGQRIEFRLSENVMINATEMAKPFGKKPKDWLKTGPTKHFLQALIESKLQKSSLKNSTLKSKRQISLLNSEEARCENLTLKSKGNIIPLKSKLQKSNLNSDKATPIGNTYHSYYAGLVIGQHGGANPGTWMHEDVAIEFARWLNPKFAIWCNDRIKEILRSGNPLPVPTKQPRAKKAEKLLTEPIIIDGLPLVEYFKEKSSAIINNIGKTQSHYAEKHGQPLVDIPDLLPFKWYDSMSVESNLKNLLSFMNNNTVVAIRTHYELRKYKALTGKMQKKLQNIADDLYNDFNILAS